MDAMDEMELVQKSQRNNRAAFNQLVLKYQDTLYNTVYRMAGNSADALDICQESFIRAYLNIKSFKGKSSFQTWLYQIALNQFYTHHQKTKRDKERKACLCVSARRQADYQSRGVLPYAPTNNPAQHLETQEQTETVQSALNSLPLDLKQIVVFKDIEGYSYKKIAGILKISIHTVRARLDKSRQQLREILKKYL